MEYIKNLSKKAIFLGFLTDYVGSILLAIVFFVILLIAGFSQNELTSNIFIVSVGGFFGLMMDVLGGFVAGYIAKRKFLVHAVSVSVVFLLFKVIFALPVITGIVHENMFFQKIDFLTVMSFVFAVPFTIAGGLLAKKIFSYKISKFTEQVSSGPDIANSVFDLVKSSGVNTKTTLAIASFCGVISLALLPIACVLTFFLVKNPSDGLTRIVYSLFVISSLVYIVFLWGYKTLARVLNSNSLNRNVNLFLFSEIVIMLLSLVIVLFPNAQNKFSDLGTFIVVGIISISFGNSLIKLKDSVGSLVAKIGKLNKIAGILFLTLILFIPGLVVSIIAQVYMIQFLQILVRKTNEDAFPKKNSLFNFNRLNYQIAGGLIITSLLAVIFFYPRLSTENITSFFEDALYGTNNTGDREYTDLLGSLLRDMQNLTVSKYPSTYAVSLSNIMMYESFKTQNDLKNAIYLLQKSIEELERNKEIDKEIKEEMNKKIKEQEVTSDQEKTKMMNTFNSTMDDGVRLTLVSDRYSKLGMHYKEILKLYEFLLINSEDYELYKDEEEYNGIGFFSDSGLQIYNNYIDNINSLEKAFIEAHNKFLAYGNELLKKKGIYIRTEEIQEALKK